MVNLFLSSFLPPHYHLKWPEMCARIAVPMSQLVLNQIRIYQVSEWVFHDVQFSIGYFTNMNSRQIITGYVATAGVIVIILVGYYVSVFDPAVDCFKKDHDTQGQAVLRDFRPNRLDETLLQCLRSPRTTAHTSPTAGSLSATGSSPTAVALSASPAKNDLYWSRWRTPLSKVRI